MTTDKPMPEWNDTNIQTAVIMANGTEEQQADAREFFGHYLLGKDWRPKPFMNLYLLERSVSGSGMEEFNRLIVAAPNEEVARSIKPRWKDDESTYSDKEITKLFDGEDPSLISTEELLTLGFGPRDRWCCTCIGTSTSTEPKLILSNFRHA